jgi:hypothetical protein
MTIKMSKIKSSVEGDATGAMEKQAEEMTVRMYAAREEISLGTAYRRLWQGQIRARKIYGRWVISEPRAESDTKSEVSDPVTRVVE